MPRTSSFQVHPRASRDSIQIGRRDAQAVHVENFQRLQGSHMVTPDIVSFNAAVATLRLQDSTDCPDLHEKRLE